MAGLTQGTNLMKVYGLFPGLTCCEVEREANPITLFYTSLYYQQSLYRLTSYSVVLPSL